jgi:hypothetical protein
MVQAPAEYASAPREAVVALTDAARMDAVASVLNRFGFYRPQSARRRITRRCAGRQHAPPSYFSMRG